MASPSPSSSTVSLIVSLILYTLSSAPCHIISETDRGYLLVLLIPVLAFATIGLSYQWDYAKMGLHFTRSGRGYEGPYDEKAAAPAPTNGTNGAEV